jgi:hypothetical protein
MKEFCECNRQPEKSLDEKVREAAISRIRRMPTRCWFGSASSARVSVEPLSVRCYKGRPAISDAKRLSRTLCCESVRAPVKVAS